METHPDLHKTTARQKAVPESRRAPSPIRPPQWLLVVAVALLAGVAVAIGNVLLRSGDETTATPFEPLIVPEEQAFIDFQHAPVPAVATVTATQLEPLIGVEEQAFIDFQHAPVPAVVTVTAVEPLIGPEEQAAIDARLAPVAVTATQFEPLMGPEEQAFANGEYDHPAAGSQTWCDTHMPC